MDLIEAKSVFSPATGFIARGGFDFTCNPYVGCTFGCSYCLAPESLIYHADLTWRPLGSVRVGDELVAFDEYPPADAKRHFRQTVVENVWKRRKPTIRIITATTELLATAEHRWLIAGRCWWRRTDQLRVGWPLKRVGMTPALTDTPEYQLGYLAGMTLGDGTMRYTPGQRSDKCGDPQAYWRVALKDREPLDRLVTYLAGFGVEAFVRPFSAATETRAAIQKVEVRSLARLQRIHDLVHSPLTTPDHRRGFVAGFFDAEGANDANLRIYQLDTQVLQRVADFAGVAGFRFHLEQHSSSCPSLRLLGRAQERMRFLSWMQPAISRKRRWEDWEFEAERDPIVAIEPGPVREVIDIQTSTGTFFANGMATHNCYAAFLPQNPKDVSEWGRWFQAKKNAVELAQKHAKKTAGKAVYMSSVTDPYQPVERSLQLSRGILEALVPHQPRLAVQTRGPLVVRDTDVLAEFDAVRVNVSIPTDSEDVRMAFEPKAPPLEKRWEAVSHLRAAGIPVGICVTPTLPIADAAAFADRIAGAAAAVVVTQDFHDSHGGFGADTGAGAKKLRVAMNWGPAEYREFVAALQKRTKTYEGEKGFFPPKK